MQHNIALVGCGAMAQAFYLPALAKLRSNFNRVWLIDPSNHALTKAGTFVQGDMVRGLSEIDDDLDFLVIAAPNALHYSTGLEGLGLKAHLLIEKPFVIWPEEGRRLMVRADDCKRVVAINQTRRLYPITQNLRQRIEAVEFGALKSITHQEGVKLNWPFESGAAFTKDAERTGVIMDFGVHVLDFYEYLLQPNWTFIAAKHDGFRGPEGLAEIKLEADGVPVSVRLSRYYSQKNVAHL
jgi:predicted dehydrogenase